MLYNELLCLTFWGAVQYMSEFFLISNKKVCMNHAYLKLILVIENKKK